MITAIKKALGTGKGALFFFKITVSTSFPLQSDLDINTGSNVKKIAANKIQIWNQEKNVNIY